MMKNFYSFVLLCAVVVFASCKSKNDAPVPVSGIALSESAIGLEAGKAKKLYTYVTPTNATDSTVVWTSNDKAIAKVYPNGVVEALAKGTATITATTKDGGKKASCTVSVFPTMTATASSEANLSGNEGGAAFAIDGNLNTFWHNFWGSPNAPLPHWVKVDLGMLYNVSDIEFWRRGNNNDLKTCDLEVSADDVTWTPVDVYTFTEKVDQYRKHVFATPVQIQYVRVNVTESSSEGGRGPHAGIAEIKVNRTPIN